MTTTWLVAGCLIVLGLTQVLAGSRLIARVKRPLGLGDIAHSMAVAPVIESAALVKDAVRSGEVWRLLTAELMHGHPLHFLFNFMALLAVGRLVEMHGHPLYVPAVFLVSALCASASSFLFSAAPISVGASGGIMGLIGFLAVIGIRRRHVVPRGFLKSIAMSIALTAATGLVAYHFIDNAAHAGGLLGGVLLGLVYIGRRNGRTAADDSPTVHLNASTLAKAVGWASAAALVAATAATVWLVFAATQR
jgi:membrane associated rhomboid family serine protease